MAPGEHFSTLLEMPNGEVRTHNFSVVTNASKKSSVISWQFDPKRDGFWTAAAQDASAQMSTKLAHAQTFHPGEILPVFTVTNSNGGVMTGSIEYHVHLSQSVADLRDSMASNQ
jgi:hypothetical protein